MKPKEIQELRYKIGLNKTKFGHLLGVSGAQITNWEKQVNTPSREKVRILERLAAAIRENPERIDGVLAEIFGIDRLREAGIEYRGMKWAGKDNAADKSVRQLANEIYQRLPPESKARADLAFIKTVMEEKLKLERGLNKEERED